MAVIAIAGAAFFELAVVGVSGQSGTHSDPCRHSLRAFLPWPPASLLLASFPSYCEQQFASPTTQGASPGYWQPGALLDDPSSRQRSCS